MADEEDEFDAIAAAADGEEPVASDAADPGYFLKFLATKQEGEEGDAAAVEEDTWHGLDDMEVEDAESAVDQETEDAPQEAAPAAGPQVKKVRRIREGPETDGVPVPVTKKKGVSAIREGPETDGLPSYEEESAALFELTEAELKQRVIEARLPLPPSVNDKQSLVRLLMGPRPEVGRSDPSAPAPWVRAAQMRIQAAPRRPQASSGVTGTWSFPNPPAPPAPPPAPAPQAPATSAEGRARFRELQQELQIKRDMELKRDAEQKHVQKLQVLQQQLLRGGSAIPVQSNTPKLVNKGAPSLTPSGEVLTPWIIRPVAGAQGVAAAAKPPLPVVRPVLRPALQTPASVAAHMLGPNVGTACASAASAGLHAFPPPPPPGPPPAGTPAGAVSAAAAAAASVAAAAAAVERSLGYTRPGMSNAVSQRTQGLAEPLRNPGAPLRVGGELPPPPLPPGAEAHKQKGAGELSPEKRGELWLHERMKDPSHKQDVANIENFKAMHRLGDEAELGLRLLSPDKLRRLFGPTENMDLSRKVSESSHKDNFVLSIIAELDPDAYLLVRELQRQQAVESEAAGSDRDKGRQRQDIPGKFGGGATRVGAGLQSNVGGHAGRVGGACGMASASRGPAAVASASGAARHDIRPAPAPPMRFGDPASAARDGGVARGASGKGCGFGSAVAGNERPRSRSPSSRRSGGFRPNARVDEANRGHPRRRSRSRRSRRRSRSRNADHRPSRRSRSRSRRGGVGGGVDGRVSMTGPPPPPAYRGDRTNARSGGVSSSSVARPIGGSLDRKGKRNGSAGPSAFGGGLGLGDGLGLGREERVGGLDGPARGGAGAAAPTSSRRVGGETHEEWLQRLDPKGSMLRYLPALRREFSTMAEVAAAYVQPPPGSKGVLASVEPTFFQALGVESLGHRLVLAKGILALNGVSGKK
eukprot:TRINITY_DN9991_c0_g1_i4.p1 TRINITY_DN9991_c0_g1~~TRINITY_DN9991_c0_g1_i4.p1  ORF type:complete len:951 (+),score=190.78 TRINITY_DN9991_c0_g1_i4:76-2853(+)